MFCTRCGKELPAQGNFCPFCGEKITDLQMEEASPVRATLSDKTQLHDETADNFSSLQECPHCHSKKCQPVVKTNTQVKNGGYSCMGGACGGLLLGPIGLLLGLCGKSSSVSTTSQTRWVCMNCGAEFLSKPDAKKEVQVNINGAFWSAICGYILSAISMMFARILPYSVAQIMLMCGFFLVPISLLCWIAGRKPHDYTLEELMSAQEVEEWEKKKNITKILLIAYLPIMVILYKFLLFLIG